MRLSQAARRTMKVLVPGLALMLLGFCPSDVQAQLMVDFSRVPDDEPLQQGWQPFQGDDVFPITESFDLGGTSIDVTVEGNTHWRNYRPATDGFDVLSDLLRDGPLCNDACNMSLTLENLVDGDYDLRAYLHTTQFGDQDGRPFTPFSIYLTDGNSRNELISDNVFMSDDSSDDLSTELIPFSVVRGGAVSITLEKLGGTDHMQLAGFELGARGTLGAPPVIVKPPPPPPIELQFPDGLQVDFSRTDEFPLQEDWEPFSGDGTDVFTESFDFEGSSVDVTIEGNTHWRDYQAATGPFEEFSDLLSDGPLCNATCTMFLTLEGLKDGAYEFTAILHTTQFGPQDNRPFTPFEIRLTDGVVNDEVIADEKFMSDNSSDELSTETIPFTVSGGSAVEILFEKFAGNDHLALAGFVISSPGLQGDFNANGSLDAGDIDLLSEDVRSMMHTATFDLNADGQVNDDDRTIWVKNLAATWFGDANLDGLFGSADLVTVFQRGKYEQEELAGWADGDWNGDGRFSSGDLVTAFQDGGYEQGPLPAARAVPEPACIALVLWGLLAVGPSLRRPTRNRR